MRIRSWLVVGLVVVSALTGCSRQVGDPLPSIPVVLSLSGGAAGQEIHIGVLVAPKQGEGSEYRDVADGVRVGAYRFTLSGAKISIDVALDPGTADGVRTTLTQLAAKNVSGIIVVSAGAHIREAMAGLKLDPPVLLPYENPDTPVPGVWGTGPNQSSIQQTITTGLGKTHASHPYVVTGDGQTAPKITAAKTEAYGNDTANNVYAAIQSGLADSLVVAAGALTQARLIAAVQQQLGVRQIPVITTPQALTPIFGTTLLQTTAVSSTLMTVGPNTSDPAALDKGTDGAHAATFYAALRLAAADPNCLNLFGDTPLSQTTQTADMASQDATIALIRAVETAGTTSPATVKQTLQTMTVTQDQGLSGPGLDFTKSSALPDSAVKVLYASSTDPGVRPPMVTTNSAAPTTGLVWFPVS